MNFPIEGNHKIEENFLNSVTEEIFSVGKYSTDQINDFVKSFLNEHIEATMHRKKCLTSVFEMFLVFIYHGKRFADFISMLRAKANEFVEKETTISSSMDWFHVSSRDEKRNYKKRFKNKVYKFLFEMVSGLYEIFKDVRLMKIGELLRKYTFLSITVEKVKKNLLSISSLIAAEDVFLVGLSRVASSSKDVYKPEQLVPAINNTHVLNFFKNNDATSAFQKIMAFLPGTVSLSQATQKQIKWTIAEYLDPRNPFIKESIFLETNSDLPLRPLTIIASEPPINKNESTLNQLREPCDAKTESISILSAALQSLYKRDITLENIKSAIKAKAMQMKFFDFNGESDQLTSSSKYLLFKSTDCSIPIVKSGTLSLLLHAVRLLYLQETLNVSSIFHFTSQLLLNKLWREDSLDSVDAAKNLHLDESSIKSEEYSLIIRQFLSGNKSKQFIDLGSVSFSSIPTDSIYSNSIRDLLCKLHSKDANVFFVNVSLPPDSCNDLPRVLTYNYNKKQQKTFEDYSSNDTSELHLVLFGCAYYSEVYSNYKFQFVSFSTRQYSGRHCIVTFDDGNSQNIAVLDTKRVSLRIDDSYNLVGMIMLRSQYVRPYPPNETIWRIKSDSFINDGLDLAIVTTSLGELESSGRSGWLSSSTINAFLVLLSNYLKNQGTQSNSRNIIVDSCLYQSFSIKRDDGKYVAKEGKQSVNIRYGSRKLAGVPSDSVLHFPINTDKSHWRSASADMKAKRIYLMNSYGNNLAEVCDCLVAFFNATCGTGWQCISLKCPHQDDVYNCGIFTIMNIAYVVQNIAETQNTSVLTNAAKNRAWGQKTIPCEQIRDMLAAILRNRNTDISNILELAKL